MILRMRRELARLRKREPLPALLLSLLYLLLLFVHRGGPLGLCHVLCCRVHHRGLEMPSPSHISKSLIGNKRKALHMYLCYQVDHHLEELLFLPGLRHRCHLRSCCRSATAHCKAATRIHWPGKTIQSLSKFLYMIAGVYSDEN